jgi:hypothetical protein
MWNDSRCRESQESRGCEGWKRVVGGRGLASGQYVHCLCSYKGNMQVIISDDPWTLGFFRELCGLRQGQSTKCGCLQFALHLPAPYIGELHFFSVIHTSDGKFTLADEVVVFDVIRQAAISWKSNAKCPHDLVCSRAATGNEDSSNCFVVNTILSEGC